MKDQRGVGQDDANLVQKPESDIGTGRAKKISERSGRKLFRKKGSYLTMRKWLCWKSGGRRLKALPQKMTSWKGGGGWGAEIVISNFTRTQLGP